MTDYGTYNGNAQYIEIDGVDVSTLFNTVDLNASVGSEDTSAGANLTDVQRQPTLKDTDVSMKLKYQVGSVPTQIQYFNPGLHTLVLGVEGKATGKPQHKQDFILESTKLGGASVKKSSVLFDVSGKAAAAPTTNMFAGGVFS